MKQFRMELTCEMGASNTEEKLQFLCKMVRLMKRRGVEVKIRGLTTRVRRLVTGGKKVMRPNRRSAPGWTEKRQQDATAALMRFAPGGSGRISKKTGIHRSILVHLLRGKRMGGRETIKKIVECLQTMSPPAPETLIRKFSVMLEAPTPTS